MTDSISPKYQMKLIAEIEKAIWEEYSSYKNVRHYIEKWHVIEDGGYNYWENFQIATKEKGDIDLLQTLHNIDGDTLLKIAIDIGVDTPDFIPSIPTFKNAIKASYQTAYDTFQKAFKQIETHPDIAIGLANSALESIIKEIMKDDRMTVKIKATDTLYNLTAEILKVFQLFPNSTMPAEIKTIGSSLLSINKSIEKLRSEKTDFHGKTGEDYVIKDCLYTYFVVNSVTTIGLFLNSYYRIKFPKTKVKDPNIEDLPF